MIIKVSHIFNPIDFYEFVRFRCTLFEICRDSECFYNHRRCLAKQRLFLLREQLSMISGEVYTRTAVCLRLWRKCPRQRFGLWG
jgi:hypothetical protein